MKKFEAPEMEVMTLAIEDVITSSTCVLVDCPLDGARPNEGPIG